MTDKEITHEGIVVSDASGKVMVEISPHVSCAGCHASNICNVEGKEKKILIVENNENSNFQPGTRVKVSVSRIQGYFALFLGYILPLLILLISLVTTVMLSVGELFAGVISLVATALYYLILFLSGKSVSKKFSFKIKTL